MAIRLRSSQVQQEFGDVMDHALAGTEVIVERYGSPKVVIVNYNRYQQLLEAERHLLRDRLQRASEAVSRLAAHLSDEEVDNLIEQARNEANEDQHPE